MASYKLIYFDGKGRAENTRMLFTLAGQKFEDVRLTNEQWTSYKPETLYGQLPLLEVDGKKLCQSVAIETLVAKTFGFAGDNDLMSAKILMIMMCIEDLYSHLDKLFDDNVSEDEKNKVRKEMSEVIMPKALGNMEKFVECDKHFFGNKLTLADLAFYNGMDVLKTCGMKAPIPPKLQAVCKSVETNPILTEYISKRAVTEF